MRLNLKGNIPHFTKKPAFNMWTKQNNNTRLMLQCVCIKTETNRTHCESSLVSFSFKGKGCYRYTTYCITNVYILVPN